MPQNLPTHGMPGECQSMLVSRSPSCYDLPGSRGSCFAPAGSFCLGPNTRTIKITTSSESPQIVAELDIQESEAIGASTWNDSVGED